MCSDLVFSLSLVSFLFLSRARQGALLPFSLLIGSRVALLPSPLLSYNHPLCASTTTPPPPSLLPSSSPSFSSWCPHVLRPRSPLRCCCQEEKRRREVDRQLSNSSSRPSSRSPREIFFFFPFGFFFSSPFFVTITTTITSVVYENKEEAKKRKTSPLSEGLSLSLLLPSFSVAVGRDVTTKRKRLLAPHTHTLYTFPPPPPQQSADGDVGVLRSRRSFFLFLC